MKHKQRLDETLVQRSLCCDLRAAKRLILAGEVIVNDHRQCSVAFLVEPTDAIRLKSRKAYVSRGGKKLAGALHSFKLNITSLNCVDLGSSTGGFTDCMLQAGAAHVSAIDVNYGQFHWSLRQDARVSLFERTNIRGVNVYAVKGPFDFAAGDLSFISLTKVLRDVFCLLKDNGQAILLIKPQFEARPDEIGRGGIVRDPKVHIRCIEAVLNGAAEQGFRVGGLCPSSIRGAKGNREYLVLLHKDYHKTQECSTIAQRAMCVPSAETCNAHTALDARETTCAQAAPNVQAAIGVHTTVGAQDSPDVQTTSAAPDVQAASVEPNARATIDAHTVEMIVRSSFKEE